MAKAVKTAKWNELCWRRWSYHGAINATEAETVQVVNEMDYSKGGKAPGTSSGDN